MAFVGLVVAALLVVLRRAAPAQYGFVYVSGIVGCLLNFSGDVKISLVLFLVTAMFERFISGRYLRANKGFASVVSWFSFIGIALGVATLIIVTSVMNGFKEDLLSRIIGMKGHIVVSPAVSCLSDYEDLTSKIKAIEGVRTAIPTIERQAVLMSRGNTRGVLIHSVALPDLISKPLIYDNLLQKSEDFFEGSKTIVGVRLAEILGLKLGDSFSLLIPGGVVTPFGSLPKESSFSVSAVFQAGMIEYDKNIIVIPLEAAQVFFNLPRAVSQIDVFLNKIEDSNKILERLKKILPQGLRILDWQHADSSIFHAVKVEKNVMTLILSIIVLVAAFNIISGLTMLTDNKIKDIAILRTMGASRRSILKIFLTIGSTIGTLGTMTGAGLGLFVSTNIDRIKSFLERLSGSSLFSEEIYFLAQIPSKIDWLEVSFIVAFSLLLCFLATLYPALKASKMAPAEALRA